MENPKEEEKQEETQQETQEELEQNKSSESEQTERQKNIEHSEELNLLLKKCQPGVSSSMASSGIQRADRPTSPLASPRSSTFKKSHSDSKKHHKSKKDRKNKNKSKSAGSTPRSLGESPLRHSAYSAQGTSLEDEPRLIVEFGNYRIPYNVWMDIYNGVKPNFETQCAWCLSLEIPDHMSTAVLCRCKMYIFCNYRCYQLFRESGHAIHCI